MWLAELATWRARLRRRSRRAHGGLGEALRVEPVRRRRGRQARRRAGSARGEPPAIARARGSAEATEVADRPARRVRRRLLAAIGPRPRRGRATPTWSPGSTPRTRRSSATCPTRRRRCSCAACAARVSRRSPRRHVVAVVGSRSPSAYGREMARAIARDLTAAGVLVVSGLALGHRRRRRTRRRSTPPAARPPTPWRTVAVLGCGADVEHPPSNRRLFARVRAGGSARLGVLLGHRRPAVALPGAQPRHGRAERGRGRGRRAPSAAAPSSRRATRSSSGASVLAVPGEAGRRLSAGPHRLLRQGAALCESAHDVLEVLGYGDLALGWRARAARRLAGPRRRRGRAEATGRDGRPGRHATVVAARSTTACRTVDQLAAAAGLDGARPRSPGSPGSRSTAPSRPAAAAPTVCAAAR